MKHKKILTFINNYKDKKNFYYTALGNKDFDKSYILQNVIKKNYSTKIKKISFINYSFLKVKLFLYFYLIAFRNLFKFKIKNKTDILILNLTKSCEEEIRKKIYKVKNEYTKNYLNTFYLSGLIDKNLYITNDFFNNSNISIMSFIKFKDISDALKESRKYTIKNKNIKKNIIIEDLKSAKIDIFVCKIIELSVRRIINTLECSEILMPFSRTIYDNAIINGVKKSCYKPFITGYYVNKKTTNIEYEIYEEEKYFKPVPNRLIVKDKTTKNYLIKNGKWNNFLQISIDG